MIAGNITLESLTIHFRLVGDKIHLSLFDAMNGECGEVEVECSDFASALAIALHPDGSPRLPFNNREYEALADAITPREGNEPIKVLRMLP